MAEGSNINLENLPTTNWSLSEYDAIVNFKKYNCKTCDVELNSSQQYQEHIQGHSHKNKARSQEIAAKQIIDSRSNLNQVQMFSQSQDSSLDSFFLGDVQCSHCNVHFTSPSHRISHYQGKKHMVAVNRMKIKDIPLQCKDCCMQFSSEISAKDHFDSERHKRRKSTEKKYNQSVSPEFKTDNTRWIHCNICNVPLNSIEQYNIHCNSSKHKKKELNNPAIRRNSLMESNFEKKEYLPSDENVRRNEGFYNQTKDFSNGMSTPPRNEKELNLTNIPNIADNINNETVSRNSQYNVPNLDNLLCTFNDSGSSELQTEEKIGNLTENSVDSSDTVLKETETCHPANSDSTHEKDLCPEMSPNSLDETISCKTDLETDSTMKTPNLKQFNKSTDTTNNTDLHKNNSPTKKLNTNNLSLPGETINDSAHSELKDDILNEYIDNMISEIKNLKINSTTNENKNLTELSNNNIAQKQSSATTGSRRRESKGANSTSDPEAGEDEIPYLQQKFIEKIERSGKLLCYFCNLCESKLNQGAVKKHIEGIIHRQKMMTSPVIERNLPPVKQTCEDIIDEAFNQTALVPRGYQVELFEKCHSTDSIIFLPTGTGKTLCAAMLISYMLKQNPKRSVLFLVDKVLLVFQQKKYIEGQLKGKFLRFDFDDNDKDVDRELIIACVCGGVVGTQDKPLWMHDIIISTAAFCLNMINQNVLRWSDFSFVVLDEAHHCVKSHPFNKIFTSQHIKLEKEKRPKILGLTASPAGEETLEGTIKMLLSLSVNMGNTKIVIVEDTVDELNKYKSNAKFEVEMLPPSNEEMSFNYHLQNYLIQCLQYFKDKSNISNYIGFLASNEKVVLDAEKLDELQNAYSVLLIDKDKAVSTSLLWHMKKITFALAASLEMGIPLALEELKSLLDPNNTTDGFSKALELGIPCHKIKELCEKYTKTTNVICEQDEIMSTVYFLIRKIINFINKQSRDDNTIVLVLVKQRTTAVRLSKILQESSSMKQYSLSTVSLIGHGAGTSTGMNVNDQKKTLEEIKNNEHQVIIATSVVEEGIDFPQCSLVITMKPPTSITALVQMRGRARKKNSLFLTICGNEKEKLKIEKLLKQEAVMEKATRSLINYYKKK